MRGRRWLCRAVEGQPTFRAHVDPHRLAGTELAGEDAPRQWVLEMALDRAAERPRAVQRVVALPREQRERGIGHLEGEARLRHPSLDVRHEQPDDLAQLRLVERLEDDDLVDAVEELRPEVVAELEADA